MIVKIKGYMKDQEKIAEDKRQTHITLKIRREEGEEMTSAAGRLDRLRAKPGEGSRPSHVTSATSKVGKKDFEDSDSLFFFSYLTHLTFSSNFHTTPNLIKIVLTAIAT